MGIYESCLSSERLSAAYFADITLHFAVLGTAFDQLCHYPPNEAITLLSPSSQTIMIESITY
jgi:hypothetical protein